MNRAHAVRCPYCGRTEMLSVKGDAPTIMFTNRCGTPGGGCGKWYVVRGVLSLTVDTLRIEGEDGSTHA